MKKEMGLSAWQLTMMALGSVIGGSFFLGCGVAIKATGPSIIISYIVGAFIVYFILFALSEMTVSDPDSSSFYGFTAEFFGRGAGFVVGWVYWTGMIFAMSSEATAVSLFIKKWIPNVSIPLLGSGIIIGITLVNLLGADRLSKLESSLAVVKVLTVVSFIVTGILLLIGGIRGISPIGTGIVTSEPFMNGGIGGVAGSMLLVLCSYSGFEIIGLAASEAENPKKTIPKAIHYTVISLVGLYLLTVAMLLVLIPTALLREDVSPLIAALDRSNMVWFGTIMNFVLVTAILSTMMGAMFGLGRMIRCLAEEGHAPSWLVDRRDVPYRGILFSGAAMLAGLGIGLLFPRVYLFLISSGGVAILFTYGAIVATHIRFRKKHGCPPKGECRMPVYPYSSLIALIGIIGIIVSMPFLSGQVFGLFAGIIMIALYTAAYMIMKVVKGKHRNVQIDGGVNRIYYQENLSSEFSEELTGDPNHKKDSKAKSSEDEDI
jgi:L-asparagine transporter-like permease